MECLRLVLMVILIRLSIGNNEPITLMKSWEALKPNLIIREPDVKADYACFLMDIMREKNISDFGFVCLTNVIVHEPNRTVIEFKLGRCIVPGTGPYCQHEKELSNCTMYLEDLGVKKKILSACDKSDYPGLSIPVYLGPTPKSKATCKCCNGCVCSKSQPLKGDAIKCPRIQYPLISVPNPDGKLGPQISVSTPSISYLENEASHITPKSQFPSRLLHRLMYDIPEEQPLISGAYRFPDVSELVSSFDENMATKKSKPWSNKGFLEEHPLYYFGNMP